MSRSIRMELPSSAEEGWTRHQEKSCEATFDGADGVVLVHKMYLVYQHHPSARAKVASRLFLNRAATPPRLRRGVPFGCFATFIEKSAHPEFLDLRSSDVTLLRLQGSRGRSGRRRRQSKRHRCPTRGGSGNPLIDAVREAVIEI